MAGIAICQNEDCIHKKECFRFISKSGEVCDFEKICNKDNNFKWLWQTETAVVNKQN